MEISNFLTLLILNKRSFFICNHSVIQYLCSLQCELLLIDVSTAIATNIFTRNPSDAS